MAYTKYSLTPANNNAAPPDGAPEGMLPSSVNDTMRDMMAQIRDCGDGIRGGTYTMTAPVITGGSINGAAIGASSASTGAFTTLAYSSTLTGGTGVVNLGSGQFYKDASGNFGLGTSSPTDKLTFNTGNIGFITAGGSTSIINFRNSGNSIIQQIYYNDADGSLNIGGANGAYPLKFSTSSTERMRIDSSGNVGIGITPTYKFDVSGVIRNASSADASPYTQQRITVYNDNSNWAYFSYGSDAFMRFVYSKTGTALPLLFGTTSATDNTGAFTETMRISQQSSLVLKGGTDNPNGIGVVFPATQSASTDPNSLDDYEEGTWTPGQGAGLTLVGAFSSTGTYTKIGRVVTVTGTLSGATSVAASAGGTILTGLPFATAQDCGGTAFNAFLNSSAIIDANSTIAYTNGAITASPTIFFNATYRAAT